MLLNENSEKYKQPSDININLKNHQLAMLNKALQIESNNEFLIMRDKPGSGKTYVVLSMIYELKKKDISKKLPKKTNVIVVPQNIYFQWSYSIERLTDNLSYLKFVEYEHLLNLYSEPQSLYNKDIILVTSSYYNTLASTLTSLELNVDRLFIDEIDNVGNLINQNFNTKFIMFISASFNFDNNNGYFTKKLKNKSEEDITILCDDNFIDKQINLEDPIVTKYLCKNLYVDKVLVNIINNDELRNINACYYKINDKNFNQNIAKDEKSLLSLISNENNSIIENLENKINDCQKNIEFYEEKMKQKNTYIDSFNSDIANITTIFNFKKESLKLTNNLLDYFKFYLNPIIEKEYEEFYDVIISNRKNNLKEFKIYIHNLNESIYNLYQLDLSNPGINENNIDNLNKVFKIIHGVIKNKSKEINKFFDDLKKINKTKNINIEIIDFIKIYEDFENYILNFYELLSNLEIVLKSDNLLKNIKSYYFKFQSDKNNYIKKRDILHDKLKKNDICPICYNIFEKTESYYISQCCNNNVCINCTEEWFNNKKKENCIYCGKKDIRIESYFKYEHDTKEKCIENIQIDDYNEKTLNDSKTYLGSKIDYLEKFIVDLKNHDYKVIIFCDFNTIFQKLEIICEENDIHFEDLEKGNINEIEKTVCNYKYGNSKILFANSSLFSCGMNLENSTHIIFVHKMDVKIIDQTIGRAQRLGRQSVLNIIYLSYENEINENNQIKVDFIDKEELNNKSSLIDDLNNNGTLININEIHEIHETHEIHEIQENVDLPTYGEPIDVNLDELIASLN